MGTFEEPRLLQLDHRHDPWKMLVCCILLNRTQRVQVDRVVDDLFADYPTPEAMATARIHELASILYPLGMHTRRAQRLVEFSVAWLALEHDDVAAVADLPGVGEYALDSYRLFVLNDTNVRPDDKELKRWVAWRESTHG